MVEFCMTFVETHEFFAWTIKDPFNWSDFTDMALSDRTFENIIASMWSAVFIFALMHSTSFWFVSLSGLKTGIAKMSTTFDALSWPSETIDLQSLAVNLIFGSSTANEVGAEILYFSSIFCSKKRRIKHSSTFLSTASLITK